MKVSERGIINVECEGAECEELALQVDVGAEFLVQLRLQDIQLLVNVGDRCLGQLQLDVQLFIGLLQAGNGLVVLKKDKDFPNFVLDLLIFVYQLNFEKQVIEVFLLRFELCEFVSGFVLLADESGELVNLLLIIPRDLCRRVLLTFR